MKRDPNALVPRGSRAARNLFNFMRFVVQQGEDYQAPLEQTTPVRSNPDDSFESATRNELFDIENSLPNGDR
jgi:hypothetical protein